MKQTSFTIYFFSLGILFIILERLNLFLPGLLVKAAILPGLVIFYYSKAKQDFSLFHKLVVLGLLFSWFGDIFFHFFNAGRDIYFDPETYFLMGLTAMLFTQLIYFVAFVLRKGKNTIFGRRMYQLILVLAYGALFTWFMYNKLVTDSGNYRLPVMAYAAALLGMLTAALNRYGKVNGVSYMLVVLGALLFLLSDSMMAVNIFYEKFDFARIMIMGTYITAQYFIAIGALRRDFDLDPSPVR